MIRLGDVLMDAVMDEGSTMDAEVTEKPVEKGQDISDHMQVKPYTVELRGHAVNDAPNKLQILRGYQKDAKLLKYVGRNIFENLVIESLSTEHPKQNGKGFDYSIKLRHVRIAVPKTFENNAKNPETGEQDGQTGARIKETTNSGRQQLKSSSIARKEPVLKNIRDRALKAIKENSNKQGVLLKTRNKVRAKIRGKMYEIY